MDNRDRSHAQHKFNQSKMTITVEVIDEEGDEQELEFPAKFAVCSTCSGHGKHVNPNVDRNGIAAEEFNEDPEFAEAYFSGRYDVTCSECKGARVVAEVDESSLSAAQQADHAAWLASEDDRLEDEEQDARVRRMEMGY